MRKVSIVSALLLGSAALCATGASAATKTAKAAPVAAQAAPAAAGQAPAEVQDAMFDLKVFMSAMAAEQFPAEAKDALAGCIYNHSLKEISGKVTEVAAQNPGKFDRHKADDVAGVLARICGYEPPAAGAATPAPAPSGTSKAPVGR